MLNKTGKALYESLDENRGFFLLYFVVFCLHLLKFLFLQGNCTKN